MRGNEGRPERKRKKRTKKLLQIEGVAAGRVDEFESSGKAAMLERKSADRSDALVGAKVVRERIKGRGKKAEGEEWIVEEEGGS